MVFGGHSAGLYLLEKHCREPYAIDTYLVLNVSHAPTIKSEDGPRIMKQLRVPANCAMLGVYLCLAVNHSFDRKFLTVLTATSQIAVARQLARLVDPQSRSTPDPALAVDHRRQ
jgi:hypothetical protein